MKKNLIGTLALALTLVALPAAAQIFPGTGVGPIPDAPSGTCPVAAPGTLNVTFNVSGLAANVATVEVDATFTHTWSGDIIATLFAPNGANLPLVGRTGATTATGAGDSSNFGGRYAFKDTAAGTNIWTVATNGACGTDCIITVGDYRTTGVGGLGQTNPPPVTSLSTTFAGLTPAQANGTWTLRFTDGCSLDTGTVTVANLAINAVVPVELQSFQAD